MKLTASKLREDIYRVLDRVIETGVPVEINRRGKTLKIISASPGRKMKNITKHDVLKGDPQDFVHLDWSDEWTG